MTTKFEPRPSDETRFKCVGCEGEFMNLSAFAFHIQETGHCTAEFEGKLYVASFLLPHLRGYERLEDLQSKDRKKLNINVDGYVPTHQRYFCRACRTVCYTWEQLKAHMMAERHCIMSCIDCKQILSWEPDHEDFPLAHRQKYVAAAKSDPTLPLHVGIQGIFRVKSDFLVPPPEKHEKAIETQFVLDHKTYTHKVFHAYALEQVSRVPVPKLATCMRCRDLTKAPLRDACLHLLENPTHTSYVLAHYPQPLQIETDLAMSSAPQLFMYQCPDCFALKSTYASLLEHMTKFAHGRVTCSTCKKAIGAEDALAHFTTSPCDRGFHCDGDIMTAKRCFVAVDRTNPDIVELIDQSDELVDPCFGSAESRFVYQCPLETCLRIYGDATTMEAHLFSSKHGVYTCPVDGCGMQLKVWEEEYLAHEHPPVVPENSHLCGKRHIQDFMAVSNDWDCLRMFPNSFRHCQNCRMVVDPHEEMNHMQSECILRTRWSLPEVRDTIIRPATSLIGTQYMVRPTTQPLVIANRVLSETKEVERDWPSTKAETTS